MPSRASATNTTTPLNPGDPWYPAAWLRLESGPGPSAVCLGDPANLRHEFIALFCSVRCPGDLILQTYDLARALRDAGVPVIGGFHSPMEKECLRLLLRGRQQVVVCPARGIENMLIPGEWRPPLAEGRLLLLSPFSGSLRRPTAELAAVRNDFVAALAHRVFVAHAAPGGKTEAFARKVLDWGKPVFTFNSGYNAGLISLGVRPLSMEEVTHVLRE